MSNYIKLTIFAAITLEMTTAGIGFIISITPAFAIRTDPCNGCVVPFTPGQQYQTIQIPANQLAPGRCSLPGDPCRELAPGQIFTHVG